MLNPNGAFAPGQERTVLSRRAGLEVLGAAALSFVSLQLARADEAMPHLASAQLSSLIAEVFENGSQLSRRDITGLQWQEVMDHVYGSMPLEQLKQFISFEELRLKLLETIGPDAPELFSPIALPGGASGEAGQKSEPHQKLITKLAYVKKGRAVPPHGHSNMVSAFLCLSGEFDVRQYDRLEDREDAMVVRQSEHDRSAGPGTWSSISDYRNNVHWLTAKSDDCFLFTVKMLNVEEGRPLHGRINLDLLSAKSLGTDTFMAKKISSAKAKELY